MDCFSVLIIIFIIAVVIRNTKQNAQSTNRPGQSGQQQNGQPVNPPRQQSIFTPTTQMPNRPITRPTSPNRPSGTDRQAVPNRPQPAKQTSINEQLKRMAAETAQREVNAKTAEQAAAEYAKRKEEARRQQEARQAQLRSQKDEAANSQCTDSSRQQMTMAQRLEQEYVRQQNEDILVRANADTEEDVTSMTKAQIFDSKETVDLSMAVLGTPAKSELMREIDDLIVKGYDGSLHFDHDFVSESVTMLSEMDGMTRMQEA